RRLLPLQAGFHVHAVDPEIDDFELVQRPGRPGFPLALPLLLQSSDRGRRQRRLVAQKTSQSQVEVSLRQSVQVQLRQKLCHFLRLALEQWQHAALEAPFQSALSRAAYGDRSGTQSK